MDLIYSKNLVFDFDKNEFVNFYVCLLQTKDYFVHLFFVDVYWSDWFLLGHEFHNITKLSTASETSCNASFGVLL